MHARAPTAALASSSKLELFSIDTIPPVLSTSCIPTTFGIECGQHHLVSDISASILRLYHKGKMALGVNLGGKWGGTVINPLVDVKLVERLLFLHICARPADQMVLQ